MKGLLTRIYGPPMAAPETAALKRARTRLLAGFGLLSILTLAWAPIQSVLGRAALALFVGLVTFLAVQFFAWMRVKTAADDEHLLSGSWRDE